jgi:hypothetical protein
LAHGSWKQPQQRNRLVDSNLNQRERERLAVRRNKKKQGH